MYVHMYLHIFMYVRINIVDVYRYSHTNESCLWLGVFLCMYVQCNLGTYVCITYLPILIALDNPHLVLHKEQPKQLCKVFIKKNTLMNSTKQLTHSILIARQLFCQF